MKNLVITPLLAAAGCLAGCESTDTTQNTLRYGPGYVVPYVPYRSSSTLDDIKQELDDLKDQQDDIEQAQQVSKNSSRSS